MGKEDIPGIIGGLKNAIERSYSLENAKESFITAGYDAADVEEAANSIGEKNFDKQVSEQAKGHVPKQSPKQVVPAQPLAALSKTNEKPLPELPKPESLKPKKKSMKGVLTIIAIIIFIIIIAILGITLINNKVI